MRFVERHPWELGFGVVFEHEIAPLLPMLERRRTNLVNRRRRRLSVTGIVAVSASLGLLLMIEDKILAGVLCAFVGFGALVALVLVSSLSQEHFEDEVAARLVPPLAAFLKVRFDPKATDRPSLDRFDRIGLLPPHDTASFRNSVAGRHREVEFSASEIFLSRREREEDSDGKTRTTSRNVFRGVFASFSLHQASPGLIVIRVDGGRVLNALSGLFDRQFKGLRQVEIPHPAFEAAFEVHAENPDAARAYISGPFLDALLAFAKPDDGNPRGLAAAFDGDHFLLSLAGCSLVAIGPVGESLSEVEPRIRTMLASMSLPIRLIDGFQSQ